MLHYKYNNFIFGYSFTIRNKIWVYETKWNNSF